MRGLAQSRSSSQHRGFTIVELIVVVAVTAILAAIVIFSYGAWQSSVRATAVKSDLNAAASAMEVARNSSTGYPLAIPSTFTPSQNVTITLSVGTTAEFCIDGQASQDTNIQYYIYSKTKDKGPQEGTCATRPDLTPPVAPASVSITSATGTTALVNWPSVADAASYIAQCAADPAYIYGPKQATVNNNVGTVSVTVADLSPSTTFYCRVKSINSKGASGWSGTNTVAVTDSSYNSLAVGTSLDGYWTTAPQGFLIEDGSAVSRTTYASLFAVIGTTYGAGDGSTTFNLPNSKGRTSVNRNASDAEFATLGQITGSKIDGTSPTQLPSHTHIQNPHDHNGGKPNPYVVADATGISVPSNAGSAFGFRYNTTTPSPSTVATNNYVGGGDGHNNIQPSITKLSVIKFSAPDSGAKTLPPGTSINGFWAAAPTGYLLEDGSAVSRTTYADLFAAIGTTYGAGNGSTTFNLPDSRGRAGVNISASDSEFDVMGEKPGSKREQLTIAQVPSHTHIQSPHNHNGGFSNPYVSDNSLGGISVSSQSGGTYGFRLRSAPSTTATNQNTGGDQDHNNIQPSMVKLAAIKYTAESGSTSSAVSPGTSLSGYWSTTPSGYLFEDGSAVSRILYANLFAVIGTTHGSGDGSTTFNLPDSRGRLGVNKNSSDTEFDTLGEKYGEKSHVITIAEMPSHTHIQNAHSHNTAGIVYISDGNFGGTAATTQNGLSYGFTLIAQPSVTATNQNTGGDDPHNEIQPSIVKRFVIKF